ncbi:TonB-dependent receptor [Rhizorhabdus dicambivorans]|nr:TonB-dependent receptor [Rhizorhabdus dicambivorans]
MHKEYDFRRAIIMGVLLLGSSMPALAQGQSGGTLRPAEEAGSADVGDIVVTARRRTERLQDVPVAATVIGQQQIRQYDLTSVANIRIAAPELSLDRGFTGSGASISLRGVSSASIDGGVEQSVLIDFDGMAISRGRITNDALFDVGSLTVLKGPQAVFFGKNSPGGVVSIKSAEPTDTFSGFVRAGYEFHADTKQVEAAISGPVGDGLAARLAIFGSDSKGYIRNLSRGVPDLVRTAVSGSTFVPAAPARLGAERRLAARATLAYDAGNGFTANLKVLYSAQDSQGVQSLSEVMGCPAGRTQPVTTGNVVDPNGDCKLNDRIARGGLSQTILDAWPQVRGRNRGRPDGKNDTFMPVLTLNYKTDSINLTSVTGYYDYDYASQGNADGTSYSYFYSYSNERNKSFYQEVRATTTLDGMFNFAAGGHYERNRRTLYVGGASGPLPMDPATGRYNTNDNEQHNRSEAWSIFGQAIAKITPELELAGGGRYTKQQNELDSFNTYLHPNVRSQLPVGVHIRGKKSQDNFSPEATLTWRPSQEITLYGAYKTGFLAGAYSNPGVLAATATLASLDFKAETVKGFELGLKTSLLDRRLTTNITGYRYIYKGLPLTSLIALNTNTLVFITQNAASTIAQGIEVESAFDAGGGTRLRATASYNDAKFRRFERAQCYTGQTVAQGCLIDPVTAARYQDLSGRAVYRAPKWIATAGISQEVELSPDLTLNATADLRYTSDYYAGLNLNPLTYQNGYVALNAGVTVTSSSGLSVALIGRNITNRRYATIALDKPGGAGEAFTVAGEPRAVVLQLGYKF